MIFIIVQFFSLVLFQLCGHAKDMYMKCRPADAVEQLQRYSVLKNPEKFTLIETKLYLMFQSKLFLFCYIFGLQKFVYSDVTSRWQRLSKD